MRKTTIATFLSLCLSVAVSGCDDGVGDGGTGTLSVQITIGDYEGNGSKASHTLDFVDVYHTVHSIYAATGVATEGQDELDWQPILEDGSEMYDSELVIDADLSAGEYKSVRIEHSNAMRWVCTDGSANYEFPALNQESAEPDAHLIQVFTVDDNFVDHGSGYLSPGAEGEAMGTTFEIVEGATTNLTIRTNFDTVTWDDADENGEWTDGVDELLGWTTIPGTDTMVDYIVE